MNNIQTIGDFLRATRAHYRIYDMGRRITALDSRQLDDIEHVRCAAPYPIMRSICLAIIFWYDDHKSDHFVWFLRFPLDETGCLQQAARDEFLKEILERVDANIQANQEKADNLKNISNESRFAFSPSDEQRAVFHARAHADLQLPPSRHYAHAVDYFDGKPGFDQWAFLGIQGLADIAARIGEHEKAIVSALPQLPAPVLTSLAGCLDSTAISGHLSKALLQQLITACSQEESTAQIITALVRASAGSQDRQQRDEICRLALESRHHNDIELLATISSRCWETLQDTDICLLFLEALAAEPNNQNAFNHLVGDVMCLPDMRSSIMAGFRSERRSEKLSLAIGAFFSLLQGN